MKSVNVCVYLQGNTFWMARHSPQLRSSLFVLFPKNFLVDGFLLDLGVMDGKLVAVGAASGFISGESFALELLFVDLSSS